MEQNNSKSVASLILGILAVISIFTGWGSFIGFVLAVIGVILGVNAKKESGGASGMATAGIALSVIGIITSSIGVICFACVGTMVGLSACTLFG